MTREEIYRKCLNYIGKNPVLLLESATGSGKSKIAIDLINHLSKKFQGKKTSMLLLVAKTVHKETWKDEITKWGGLNVDTITMECYESLKKHEGETFAYILLDEVHHIKSDMRIEALETLKCHYMIGLSATIPRNLKYYFNRVWKAWTVSCDVAEAIESEILPEPQIVLWPLELENTRETEELIINPKAKGQTVEGKYSHIWKYKRNKTQRVLIRCTQQQKLNELNSTIDYLKREHMRIRSKMSEQSWLYMCGKRLEYLADCKVPIVKAILSKLSHYRTITFCKTIEQSELLGKNCIHSKRKNATETYEKFNEKKINHITSVNILNENANLVDCKYAIFTNISSSDLIMYQRLGKHNLPLCV